jgi:hypothetical protein
MSYLGAGWWLSNRPNTGGALTFPCDVTLSCDMSTPIHGWEQIAEIALLDAHHFALTSITDPFHATLFVAGSFATIVELPLEPVGP